MESVEWTNVEGLAKSRFNPSTKEEQRENTINPDPLLV